MIVSAGQVYDKGPSPYKSVGAAFRTIVKEEGAKALYQVGILIFTTAAAAADVWFEPVPVHQHLSNSLQQ